MNRTSIDMKPRSTSRSTAAVASRRHHGKARGIPIRPGVTIGEIAVPAVAATSRSRSAGALRGARWRAEVLANHFGDTRILDVDLATVDRAETCLVDEVEVTPRSARKLVRQLLDLRRAVADALGAPQLPDVGLGPLRPAPDPWVALDEYAVLRSWLPEELQPATDLIVGCRLRPATVLQLRGDDIDPVGRTIRVRGRWKTHLLPVPAFAREDLDLLARQVGPGAPLFPGRTQGSTLNPTTLRRRVQRVSAERLGKEVNLRDLGLLAEFVLGPSSGNPAGRRAALRRIAADWSEIDAPPEWEAEEDVEQVDDETRQGVQRLTERVTKLERALEKVWPATWETKNLAAHLEDRADLADERRARVDQEVRDHACDGDLHSEGSRDLGARKGLQALRDKVRVQDTRLTALNSAIATRQEVDQLSKRVKRMAVRLRKTSTATTGLSLVQLFLVYDRVRALAPSGRALWLHDSGVLEAILKQEAVGGLSAGAEEVSGDADEFIRSLLSLRRSVQDQPGAARIAQTLKGAFAHGGDGNPTEEVHRSPWER
jgi:integrase